VGINTAIFTQGAGNIGIGFAIPANMAMQVTEQLLQFGEVRRGFLGAQLQDLDPALAEAFGLPPGQSGAVLNAIVPGSAADEAGLKAGDVVVGLNGRQINSAGELRTQIGLLRVGDPVQLEVLREGKRIAVTARVTPREMTEVAGDDFPNPRLAGAAFRNFQGPGGDQRGVVVTQVTPGSRAWQNGLRPGDILVEANRRPLTSVAELAQVMAAPGNQVLLRVRRQGVEAFMVLR
jgi:S1-C subfamily serine protease